MKSERRDGREAEGAPLLREYRVCSPIEGSNPSLSAIDLKTSLFNEVLLFLDFGFVDLPVFFPD